MIGNTRAAWGWPAMLLHWIGAALAIALIAHGGWMTEYVPRASRLEHYGSHASIGYFFLGLLLARLLWRWANAVPALPAAAPRWERWSAHLTHWGLYALMLVAALSGWALAGTFRAPLDTTLFGWLQVPAIVSIQDRALHKALEGVHEASAWGFAALAAFHVAAALFHHWVRRDEVLRRMLPALAR